LTEKLQKILAQSGLGSRRQIETLISEGRIHVEGKPAHIGQRVERDVRITFDKKLVPVMNKNCETEVLIYHKPAGEICTRNDPEQRPTVFDNLPEPTAGKWINVGRLDINTSGLLLFTNNGELAHNLTHPSKQVEREYAVRIFGDVTESMLHNLTHGVELEDGKARFEEIVPANTKGEGSNQWYYILVCAGRNRLVRRLWESQQGLQVSRLIRVRYGNVKLPPNLITGHTEELNTSDIDKLKTLSGMVVETDTEKKPAAKTKTKSKAKAKTEVKAKAQVNVKTEVKAKAENKQNTKTDNKAKAKKIK
jgi:23S rRNA pseudouridine2605 synthase